MFWLTVPRRGSIRQPLNHVPYKAHHGSHAQDDPDDDTQPE
jgi:hypothetical protein